MPELVLNSLRICGFRGLQDLSISGLGRVNLIVGANSSGKTSVLEALRLYSNQRMLSTLDSLLNARQENGRQLSDSSSRPESFTRVAIEYLFHGRVPLGPTLPPIIIGPISETAEGLALRFCWFREELTPRFQHRILVPNLEEDHERSTGLIPGVRVSRDGVDAWYLIPGSQVSYPANERKAFSDHNFIPCNYVDGYGFGSAQIGELWDQILLTDLEPEVSSALKIINESVERVTVSTTQGSDAQRLILARVSGNEHPIPLANLGDGMRRVFHIALALVNSADGFLLVDEIENGLHYTVQADLWRLIFRVARKLNIQVFATTHSRDCVEAFQKGADESPEQGVLIRLQHRKRQVEAVLFDEDRLDFVTRQQIEVRG